MKNRQSTQNPTESKKRANYRTAQELWECMCKYLGTCEAEGHAPTFAEAAAFAGITNPQEFRQKKQRQKYFAQVFAWFDDMVFIYNFERALIDGGTEE